MTFASVSRLLVLDIKDLSGTISSSTGHVVPEIVDKRGLNVADSNWEEGFARFAESSRAEDIIVVGANHTECLFCAVALKNRDRGLGALRAILEILGCVTGEVVALVDAVNDGLVAFLEAHH